MAIVHRMWPAPPYQCCRLWKTRINPDRWLDAIHGRAFARKVGTDGVVDVDDEHYSIQQALAGHEARARASMLLIGPVGSGWKGRPRDQVTSEEAASLVRKWPGRSR